MKFGPFQRNSRRRPVLMAAAVALLSLLGTSGSSSAATSHALTYRYVALGDSYSSGNGLPRVIANSGPCARSTAAYPEIVASRLGLAPVRFVACSGATIAQVAQQVGVVSSSIRTASLVTLSAGGNDLPFSGLSAACIGLFQSTTSPSLTYIPGISGPTRCRTAVANASSLLGATLVGGVISAPASVTTGILTQPSTIERRLEALYLSILNREASPRNLRSGTQLVIVQYPTLLSPNGAGNCLLAPTPLRLPFQTPVNGLYPGFSGEATILLTQVNALLGRETAAVVTTLQSRGYVRVSLSPVPTSFAPLDCRSGTSPDLNGLTISPSSSGLTSDAFHPTALGQALLASGVVSRVRASR